MRRWPSRDREDVVRVVVLVVVEIGVKPGEVLAVEREHGRARSERWGPRGRTRGPRAGRQGRSRENREPRQSTRTPDRAPDPPERDGSTCFGRLANALVRSADNFPRRRASACHSSLPMDASAQLRQRSSVLASIFSSGQPMERIMPWPPSIWSGGVIPRRSLGIPIAVRSWMARFPSAAL